MQTCPICYSYSLDWDLTDSGEPYYLPMEILRCSHCGESDPDSKRYIGTEKFQNRYAGKDRLQNRSSPDID